MTAEIPGEGKTQTAADAARTLGPPRASTESLREYLRRTPHRFAVDSYPYAVSAGVCMCGRGRHAGIHDDTGLDTLAYVARQRAGITQHDPAGAPEPQGDPGAPDRVLGYLVAVTGKDGRSEGVTHTSFMPLDEAEREADRHAAHGGARVRAVEVREVSRG